MQSSGSIKPLAVILAAGLATAIFVVVLLSSPGGAGVGDHSEEMTLLPMQGAEAGSLAAGGNNDDERVADPLGGSPESSEPRLAAAERVLPAFLTSSVKGIVKDRSDEPIEAASILIEPSLPAPLRDLFPGGAYRSQTETGSDGTFEVALPGTGAFRMEVCKEGYAPSMLNQVLPGDDLTVVLELGAELHGVVTHEETGEPIAGAQVRVRRDFRVFECLSEADGTFAHMGLPEGLVTLEVVHEAYDLLRRDGLQVVRESPAFVPVELTPGIAITGRVLKLEDRQPVAGAEVIYRIESFGSGRRQELVHLEQTTDPKGEFLFAPVSRRGYQILVLAEGFSPGRPEPDAPSMPSAASQERLVEIYLKKKGGIQGTVLDPEGRPLSRARVRLLQAGARLARSDRSTSDEMGRFQIESVEGSVPFSVLASHPSHAPGKLDGLMIDTGERLEGLEIRTQRPASIEGSLVGPGGELFAGAQVTLDGVKGILSRYAGVLPLTMSDEEGCFRFEGLMPGSYVLSAYRGELRSDPLDVMLQEGEVYRAALDLRQGSCLVGRVVNPAGEPLDDVLVTAIELELDSEGQDPAPKDRSRKQKAAKTAAKTAKGSAAKPGRAATTKAKSSKSPSKKGLQKSSKRTAATQSPQARLEQRVKNALSSSVERATPREFEIIKRLGLSRYRGSVRTDEDGNYTLSGLRADDRLVVSFKRSGYRTEVLTGVQPNVGQVPVTMTPELVLFGRVVDYGTSAPLERFRVEWLPLRGDIRSTEEILETKRSTARTTSQAYRSLDGTFLVDDMEPGEVLVRVAAKGYRTSEPRRLFISPRFGTAFQVFTLERGGVVGGKIVAGGGSPVASVPVYLRKVTGSIQRRRSERNAASDSASAGKKGGKSSKGSAKKDTGKGAWSARRHTSVRRADERGRFLFDNLDPGTYELLLANASKPVAKPVRVSLGRSDQAYKTIIVRGLGEVEIRVRPKGGLACRAEVELSGGPGKVTLRRKTGNLGFAAFTNLLPGDYRLSVKARGYKTSSQKLSVKEGSQVEKDVELEARK